ncbi:30S ribosomal protein S6e [Candidatus Woesearchaeota archaeon]|nr:30S ribosomal protein S6e [Candidatus Woesearchaeota archaeon]
MAEFKLVIADPKTGKCHQKVVQGENARPLVGKKIGDKLRGESFDMSGYEFEITGGADYCGFPMRRDIEGPVRKKILIVKGVGIRNKEQGIRKRKTVCGNTIHDRITQVCLKVIKYGKKPLDEKPAAEGEPPAEAKPAEKKEEKPKEKPAEQKKEDKKQEVKTEPAEPKKEEKPAEEKKEEAKKEPESAGKKE